MKLYWDVLKDLIRFAAVVGCIRLLLLAIIGLTS